MCSHTSSQLAACSGVNRVRGPITPERCPSTIASVMDSLPPWPNSGQ
ncbi:Uncharacterised protein [Mycobacteroides abscessus subsp. abscessus]|nr:Uncharacterised protein [Mycobacteroides abscessus subsp. abscessus]